MGRGHWAQLLLEDREEQDLFPFCSVWVEKTESCAFFHIEHDRSPFLCILAWALWEEATLPQGSQVST